MVHHCPTCGSRRIRRSRHHRGDPLVASILLAPYVCTACGERYFEPSSRTVTSLKMMVAVLGLTFGAYTLAH